MAEEPENKAETCPRCKTNRAEDDHGCPYRKDINGDYEYQCRCCHDCQHECAMDI